MPSTAATSTRNQHAMPDLKYRSHASIHALALGECTVHHASTDDGKHWWNLWFHVVREMDGLPDTFVVPVNPNGSYVENGPGGRTWGLTRSSVGIWQVSPSINVLDDAGARDVLAGQSVSPDRRSLWHQTPTIVDVPDDEPWITTPP